MVDVNQKKFKFAFILILFIFFGAFAASIYLVKDNPYFTSEYAEMNLVYMKYGLDDFLSLKTIDSLLAGFGKILGEKETGRNDEAAFAKSVPVLLYHGVVKKSDNSNVTEEQFYNQMKSLKEAGYQTVSVKDLDEFLKDKKNLPEKSFVLTFDDTRKDTYYSVDPVLKHFGYNAAIFLAKNNIRSKLGNFYLSFGEIQQMINNGRWEIGSQGEEVHVLEKISSDGQEGYYMSNKIYLENESRTESDEEFRNRIESDFLDFDDFIKKHFKTAPVAFSLPYGDFGGNSINYENAENEVLKLAANVYNMTFSDVWPKNKNIFRSNYGNGKDSDKSVTRILVSRDMSSRELADILNAAHGVSLPYKENFSNDYQWIANAGNISLENNKLIMKSDEAGASAYVDGSGAWKDYEYAVIVGNEIFNNETVSLLARYNDAQNYASCQFNGDAVLIKQNSAKDGQTILASIKANADYRENGDNELKVRAYGDTIQCFINGKPVARAETGKMPLSGGIGIKLWSPNLKSNLLSVSNLEVHPIEQLPLSGLCSEKDVAIEVADGTICRTEAELSGWLNIYDTYPLSAKGKEIIYSFLDTGQIDIADGILDNRYKMDRYEPVEIKQPITWRENPLDDSYWRFNFYNLSYTRNLLYAWRNTGNSAYKDRLISDIESFIDHGMTGPYSWDYHGAAYRTMTLVNTWWKLREENALPVDLGLKMLQTLKIHGDFLANESHYEEGYNHGLDQAAALYVLAVNFPDLPGAKTWYSIAKNRLQNSIITIVDNEGILIEYSPFYHFYVLEKYWEINQYLKNNGLFISADFNGKINKMISYATYILEPNLTTPTIGASLERKINLEGIYKEIAALNPNFLYVLTQGKQGIRPPKQNTFYPETGETIMRSGWGVGENFENQTQLIFDMLPYRTNHSELNALAFNLYGKGTTLILDPGLYTYDENEYRDYFHGTRAHNTVVVDGQDQKAGRITYPEALQKVTPGYFEEGDGFVYQSGQHNLYDGVVHERAITLVENDVVIIVDKLLSENEHNYEQMFHLFPGAKIKTDGLTLKAYGNAPDQSLTISQLLPEDIKLKNTINQTKPVVDGLCSSQYQVAVPCYSVSYSQKGTDATYITAIEIGQKSHSIKLSDDKSVVTVKTGTKEYQIKIIDVPKVERKIEAVKKYDTSKLLENQTAIDSFDSLSGWKATNESGSQNSGDAGIDTEDKIIKMTSPEDGSFIKITKNIPLDLSDKNIFFKMKLENEENIADLSLKLSSNGGKSIALLPLEIFAYPEGYDGGWIGVGAGKSENRNANMGSWWFNDRNFDWSKIDSIEFRIKSHEGKTAGLYLKDLGTIQGQNEGRVVIVFDDGWGTVWDSANIMNKYGIKGNVAIIRSSVDKKGFLSLDQIKQLQNQFGWNVVNHSNLHKDAVISYYNEDDIKGLEKDILDGLEYLIKNDVNSAPNWYIYPHGETNDAIKSVVGKYYQFARVTQTAPEVFPFSDPLAVRVFNIASNRTTPLDVHNAVQDAKKYNLTLFLVLHRLSETDPNLYTEYPVDAFESIIKDIKDQGIKVLTLSELDKENGVNQTEFKISNEIPGQIKLGIYSR